MKFNTFFYDILRDKGSTKFSITKTLALLFSLFLIIYLAYQIFFAGVDIDHTLVIELLGMIGALVGLKNNWGVGNSQKKNDENNVSEPQPIESKKDSDEGVF